jgi:hypothetical protein
MSTAPRSRRYPKYAVPVFTLFLGGLVFAAQAIGGDAEGGARSAAVLAALALVLAIGGRSETIRLIRQPDERWSALDKRATAFTGSVLILVLIGAWLWQVAHGRSGEPYVQLCSLAGLAYISSMVWLRFRA